MKKVNLFLFVIGLNTFCLFSQTPNPLDFWPNHSGYIWQYRSINTGELGYTLFIDSIKVDSTTMDRFIYERFDGGDIGGAITYTHIRIDTIGNVYNRVVDGIGKLSKNNFNPDSIRYKLYADSGDTWITGFENDTIPITVTVTNLYNAFIYGKTRSVKAFRVEVQYPPPIGTFWWNTDHLAQGLGLFKIEAEPNEVYYLSGAFIDSTLYGTITSVEEINQPPDNFDVITNYPNPFNSSTIISYSISKNSDINISVYDLLGREIKTLTNEYKQKGKYEITFEANDLSTGIYIIILRTDKNIITHKILLLK